MAQLSKSTCFVVRTIITSIIFALLSNGSCSRHPRRHIMKLIDFDIDNDLNVFYTEKEVRDELDPGRQFLNYLSKLLLDPLLQGLKMDSAIEIYRRDSEKVTALKGRLVRFDLFTLNNRRRAEVLQKDVTIKNSRYWNKNSQVKIIIHGYLQTTNVTYEFLRALQGTPELIKDAYMDMNRTENIITVDYQKLAGESNYFNSVRNTFVVGYEVAEFVMSLINEQMLPSYEDVHIIGFSLGGQAAGIAGHLIHQKTGMKVGRITGLDPAGPGFEANIDKIYRLDKDDAVFVDVVHCSAGDILSGTDKPGRMGTKLLCGDVDFFANGGVNQPGCTDFILDNCSHYRCPQYFADTIRGKKYTGCLCTATRSMAKKGKCDCMERGPIMGEFCPISAQGIYYVNTFV